MSKKEKIVDVQKRPVGKKFSMQELEYIMQNLAESPYKYSAPLIQFLSQNGEVVFEEEKNGKDDSEN